MALVFIGAGNMAGALIGGLINNGRKPDTITAIDPSDQARDRIASMHGVVATANLTPLEPDDVVVLAVKPQIMRAVASGLAPYLNGNLVISVAAGILMADLQRWLGDHDRLIRVMPNTPCLIGEGISGLLLGDGAGKADGALAESLLATVGEVIEVNSESLLDTVTAISGSGPAYVFRWMEAMIAAGTSLGLSDAQARQLVLQTFKGASALALKSDDSPATLRANVTSKGGTTAAALESMANDNIGTVIGDAVRAAHARSAELGRELGGD